MRQPIARLLVTCMILAAAYGCTDKPGPATQAHPEKTSASQHTYPVIKVVDGDTIHIQYEGKKESIRLLRIDTPERGKPYYNEATEALRRLIANRRVRLEFEQPGGLERDRYKRLLCYVYVGNKNLNIEMVRRGWSRFWTKYGGGRLADQFRKAEWEARAVGVGVWAPKARSPVGPR